MQWLWIIPEKPYFRPFLVLKSQIKIILKAIICDNFDLAVTSCRKLEKFYALTFNNTCKTPF